MHFRRKHVAPSLNLVDGHHGNDKWPFAHSVGQDNS
jgi:hypothetical protein